MATPVNAAYYPNWRGADGFSPADLDLDHLTHVFYAFATLQASGTVCASDPDTDCLKPVSGVKGCLSVFKQLKTAKYPHLKVVLSIGGGAGSTTFPVVASDPEARKLCAITARALVDRYELDGIDIDWETPSTPEQGRDYLRLLVTLRDHLPPSRYLLTTALPAGEWALQHVDLREASKLLDYVNLMAYDFYGPWTEVAGNHAQLCPSSPDDPDSPHSKAGVDYSIAQGMPASKLLLGIPVYGRAFRGARGAGDQYKVSDGDGEDGVTFEYKELPRPGSTESVNQIAVAASCVDRDAGWISYDNVQTVAMKAQFVKREKLGGLFYWHGCGDAKGPRSLVRTGHRELHRP